VTSAQSEILEVPRTEVRALAQALLVTVRPALPDDREPLVDRALARIDEAFERYRREWGVWPS
jgi:hypothetical protein